MDTSINGKLAIVTGGARGIGKGIAEELLRRGARVVIADILADEMAAACSDLGSLGTIDSVHMDISDPESIEAAVGTVRDKHGPIEILVNNAGVGKPGLFAEVPPDSIAKTLSIDLVGALYLTRQVLPDMLANGWGRICNMSSMMALTGSPGFAIYSTAKSGLLGFSEALERELRHLHQITVTAVLPPSVRTKAFDDARTDTPKLMRWNLVPPISVKQAARQTVQGLTHGRKRVYCGAQSLIVDLSVRFAPWLMDAVLMFMFRPPGRELARKRRREERARAKEVERRPVITGGEPAHP